MENYQITFRGNEWKYSRTSPDVLLKTFLNKLEAVNYAIGELKDAGRSVTLTIHKKNGDVQSQFRYPNSKSRRAVSMETKKAV